MDRRERVDDPEVSLREAFDGLRAGIWTALPGVIQSFDDGAMTCEVQPTIKIPVRRINGTVESVALPLLVDCPVQFPSGGNCSLTFPVAPGDECLVVFASRCIDGWWQSGGVQEQAELRMHDLSDGFVLLGFRSKPRALAGVSATAAQLRTDDGQAFVEVNAATHAINIQTTAPVNVTSTASASVTAPSISLGAAGQSLLSFVTSAFQALFNGHTHTSAGAGSPTSVPNQAMGSTHLTSTVKGG
ncbi:Gp138 family membrane-puncturing spike protein [Cupriavidus taiwanensis]|uniref:Gp138 family membrane-puncturing spike protein n=1 Tax=Cupriavidus taiwanensis TaxID=164546 RepID=UPI000E13FDF9|nr:Gp138 family membrane-puncturing spike protein [Cupriavidus taiwanensis]SPA44830.1 putative bacteriophage protein [Cupriavidus taiwanensis]